MTKSTSQARIKPKILSTLGIKPKILSEHDPKSPARVTTLLLEIGFIKEMRTTWGNQKMPQTFFHNSIYSQKYSLIHVTQYHWQTCIS